MWYFNLRIPPGINKSKTYMYEHFFQCPYCWEEISMLLDTSVRKQTYIEDCEICCNPIEIYVRFENNELLEFEAGNIEQ